MTTAVVPVAGFGTRLLPATKSQPKEMLPVGGKPVVQHVVEELAAAGIERIVFVTGRGKGAIEDHFDRRSHADRDARGPRRRGAARALGVRAHGRLVRLHPPALAARTWRSAAVRGGLHRRRAVRRCARDAILGTREKPAVVARLAQALETRGAGCAIAVRDVPRAQTGRYGIVTTDGAGEVTPVTAIVEHPDPEQAPSTLAVAARYVMSPAIYGALRASAPGASGELELTDAIARLIADGTPVVAVRLGDVERHDVGTHESYAAAFLRFALTDPDYGSACATSPARCWTMTSASALARSGLVGHPSDGYGGATLSVTLRNFAAEVHAEPAVALDIAPIDDGQWPEGGQPLVAAAVTRFGRRCTRHDVPFDGRVRIRYGSTIPREVGLGGSSAIVIATLRALAATRGLTIPARSCWRSRSRSPSKPRSSGSPPGFRTASRRPTRGSSLWTSNSNATSRWIQPCYPPCSSPGCRAPVAPQAPPMPPCASATRAVDWG